MAPELLLTMEADELRELGQKIRDWQTAKGLTDADLIRKFGELGSDKTYKKVRDGELAELDLEKQLNNYRTAWALMEGDTEEREEHEIEKDLFATITLNRVWLETRREKGLARCIFLIGPSGSGKTSAQDFLRDAHGPRILSVRAVVAWGDSPMAMMAAVLKKLGTENPPMNQADRFNVLVEKLKTTRRALFIEDAHHLGPRCLALVISLIDETPGEFLLAAVDSLWAKIQTKAYQEIEQLRVNRLAEKITLGREVRPKDVEKLLTRRVQWEGCTDDKATQRIVAKVLPLLVEKANNFGRLAFVREVIKRALDTAGKAPMSAELFTAAITQEIASR